MSFPKGQPQLDRTLPSPLYRQIVDFLRDQILAGKLPPGHKLPTDQELAEMLKISRGTAALALRTVAQEGLIERGPKRGSFVRALAQAGWQPTSKRVPTLPVSAIKAIGLLLPRTDNVLSIGVLRGIQKACRSRDFHVLSAHSQENAFEELGEVQRMIQASVAGLILLPISSSTKDSAVSALKQTELPFVLIDRYLRGCEANYVGSDHFGASFAATEHLILLGHKSVSFVLPRDVGEMPTSVQERLEGYRAALNAYGRAFSDKLIFEARGSLTDSDPSHAYEDFFEGQALATAAVAVNDDVASLLLQAAERMGIKVPQELAVVGFDDAAFSSRLTVPLTTVVQPFEEVGFKAAHLLIDHVEQKVTGAKHVILPTVLKIRASCGARQSSPALEK